MEDQLDLRHIDSQIQAMKKVAEELQPLGADFPALARNLARVLASLKMLEINISDVVALEAQD
ncbi:MAG: hypothetical protein JSW39_07925 [Desulfobacterales bacterium]|nr:MAG: hypothetical protein JSW39_07925 [Desulfobacterales bacterium]